MHPRPAGYVKNRGLLSVSTYNQLGDVSGLYGVIFPERTLVESVVKLRPASIAAGGNVGHEDQTSTHPDPLAPAPNDADGACCSGGVTVAHNRNWLESVLVFERPAIIEAHDDKGRDQDDGFRGFGLDRVDVDSLCWNVVSARDDRRCCARGNRRLLFISEHVPL
jgi:hypothetical protein